MLSKKVPATYILTNAANKVLYTGVTSDLVQRVFMHRQKSIPGFTQKYMCHKLVFYEIHTTMEQAILREKQIKSWRRMRKIQLIEDMNPSWKDLYDSILS
jgi:putative endonuclease